MASPSYAYSAMTQLNRNLWRNSLVFMRVDFKHTQTGSRLPLVKNNRMGIRIHTQYGLGQAWLLSHRFEYCLLRKSDNSNFFGGVALLTDAVYAPKKLPVSGSVRFAIFRTTDWSTRIYAYERDAMQGFSFPPLYGYGIRGYVNAKYTVNSSLQLWIRGSATRYLSAKHPSASAPVGRSLFEPEVKVQMRVTW